MIFNFTLLTEYFSPPLKLKKIQAKININYHSKKLIIKNSIAHFGKE